MQKVSQVVLLVVASLAFVVGVTGAIIFFPWDGDEVSQAHSAGASSLLTWQTSLAAGCKLARQEHKYILADVYTDWCGWCKKLDKDVFTDSDVVDYLQKYFVCVKVDAEEAKEGASVAKAYEVDGFPCALVFSPEGNLLGRISGYEAAKDYISTLQEIRTSETQSKTAVTDPRSPEPGSETAETKFKSRETELPRTPEADSKLPNSASVTARTKLQQ